MAEEIGYQFVLSATECRLCRTLRNLKADFTAEYPLIYNNADILNLSVEVVSGDQIIRLMKDPGASC